MITPSIGAATYRPAPAQLGDDRFVPLAAELGASFAPRAAEYDYENTFVHENFQALRQAGYTRLAIPEELGGLGATPRQVCYAQAELARSCAATALAVNMHLYITLTNVYRWRNGATTVEGLLRRVANEGLILMTSGGSDGLWPSAVAVKEIGGYRVSGRKRFCSQAPIADVLTTMAAYDDPVDGRVVLTVAIPTASEGFRIVETWDTLGLRGTASHDVELENVYVDEAQLGAHRPWGAWDAFIRNAVLHAASTEAAVYYGVATSARDEAVRAILDRRDGAGRPLAEDPALQRLVGQMDFKLRVAWWSLLGALNELGEDYSYALTDQLCNAMLLGKRCAVQKAVEVVDLALEAGGGSSFYKSSPLERAYRDVRGGKYHPLPPEKTLAFAGRLALGQSVEQVW